MPSFSPAGTPRRGKYTTSRPKCLPLPNASRRQWRGWPDSPNPRRLITSARRKCSTFLHWDCVTIREGAPLVGRTAELALLSRTIDAAAQGSGRSVFIVGEGGIGKTRLAAAAAERATRRGWTVAIGRAYPVETGVPYALFSDALLPLLRKLDPATLSILTRGGG